MRGALRSPINLAILLLLIGIALTVLKSQLQSRRRAWNSLINQIH